MATIASPSETKLYLNAFDKSIQYEGVMKTIDDDYWTKEIVPILYPMWDSDNDKLEMKIIYMDPKVHDQHISYVSHLSHITSFILAKTVIEKEIDEKNIFDLAGSGFESTVRLAKSSPEMWSPIFLQNKNYIIEALSEYINNLEVLKEMILIT